MGCRTSEVEDKPINILDDIDIVCVLWSYTPVIWVDGFTGEKHVHLVDLTVAYVDGSERHIDFAEDAYPLTKYLYAQNHLDNWELVSNNPSPVKW